MNRAPEGIVLLRNPSDIDLERTYDIKCEPLQSALGSRAELARGYAD